MGEHSFEGDLLRLLVAEIWFAISMKAARELFGRSYFALGMGERLALEQVVAATVGAMYSEITPALLRPQTKRRVSSWEVNSLPTLERGENLVGLFLLNFQRALSPAGLRTS